MNIVGSEDNTCSIRVANTYHRCSNLYARILLDGFAPTQDLLVFDYYYYAEASLVARGRIDSREIFALSLIIGTLQAE